VGTSSSFLSANQTINRNRFLSDISVKITLSLNEEERRHSGHLEKEWLIFTQFMICPFLAREDRNQLYLTEKAWVKYSRFQLDLRFNNIFNEHVKPGKT